MAVRMQKKYTRRDSLAENRTHLANERTLLAYIRTSFAFFALGVFIIKFFPSSSLFVIATISIFFGFGLLVYGIKTFLATKEKINRR